jgi:N-acetylneuraminate lyase
MSLHGTVAAVVTPLRDAGARLDLDAVGSIAAFVAAAGADGVLVAGTTGEGILLSAQERRALTAAWIAAAPAGVAVAVHAGAQTTAETVALAEHAAAAGATSSERAPDTPSRRPSCSACATRTATSPA